MFLFFRQERSTFGEGLLDCGGVRVDNMTTPPTMETPKANVGGVFAGFFSFIFFVNWILFLFRRAIDFD